MQVVELLDMK